jgi:4-hydroxybenzoate polyprenyltransferase
VTPARLAWTLFKASHPEPVVAVTASSALLAAAAPRGGRRRTLTAAAAVLAGQLFTGWTNDLLDRELDRKARRRDKPLATGELDPRTAMRAMTAALPAALLLSARLGKRELAAHSIGLAAAAAYNLGLRATWLSWLPYAIAFPFVPVFAAGEWPRPWVLVTASQLGIAAHLAQVLPDIEQDRRQHVLGLPQRLGVANTASGIAVLITGCAAMLTLAVRRRRTTWAAIGATAAAGAAAKLGHSGRPKAAFRATLVAAGLLGAGYALSSVDEADQRNLAGPDRPVIDHAPGDEVHLGDHPGTV